MDGDRRLAALHQRAATGKGGVISASLYETALFWMGVPTASFLAGKEVPHRLGTENGSLAPYKAYRGVRRLGGDLCRQ